MCFYFNDLFYHRTLIGLPCTPHVAYTADQFPGYFDNGSFAVLPFFQLLGVVQGQGGITSLGCPGTFNEVAPQLAVAFQLRLCTSN